MINTITEMVSAEMQNKFDNLDQNDFIEIARKRRRICYGGQSERKNSCKSFKP